MSLALHSSLPLSKHNCHNLGYQFRLLHVHQEGMEGGRGIEIDKFADDFCAVQSAGNWMVASISATKLRSDAASLHCQYIVEQRLKCLT